MTISKDLLEILACPKCKGDLVMTDTEDGLVCEACKLKYPIKDDIPVMLIDEAEPIQKAVVFFRSRFMTENERLRRTIGGRLVPQTLLCLAPGHFFKV